MKVENSSVAMYSKTQVQYSHSSSVSSQIFYENNQNPNTPKNEEVENLNEFSFSFSNSISITSSTRVVYDYEKDLSPEDKIKKILIEILLGKLHNKKDSMEVEPTSKVINSYDNISNPYNNSSSTPKAIGAIFNTTHEYYHKQTIDFSSSVKINTPNSSFELDLNISFSKEMYESSSSTLAFGQIQTMDPLVVNFDEDINPFENLSQLNFEFDLDNDGKDDLIPLLKQGAGFLALDKNKNGKIDNGSELFGSKSGNGFKDLGEYDKDNNNWIDENDSIFNKLKIWQKDDEGEAKLLSLIDLNIGAIYLGDIQSGYEYKNSIENTQAIAKSNGIFVKEDGSGLGVVNSLDIAI